jgi:uncharacterized protein (UPF0332 family)
VTDEAAYLISRRFEQATETLDAAMQLLHSGHLRDAINRAYYSMFYAGLALLATRMLGASKHSGVISLFGKHFVKTGEFSPEAGRHLHEAFDLRQKSDYREDFDPTREQAAEIVTHAEAFLIEAKQYWGIQRDASERVRNTSAASKSDCVE